MNLRNSSKTTTQVTFLSLVFSFLTRFKTITAATLGSVAITCFFTASVGISVFNIDSAGAHQQKMAITTVLFNPRTNNLEIMHRFDLHDAEHAVKEIFDGDADIMQSKKTQSDFANYVVKRFAIYNMQKEELPLTFVGTELEGQHFWVYQETPAPGDLEGMYIQHNALRDIWHKQTNTINVEGMGDIQTLTFTDSTELLSVEFTHH
ncbi:DUF6702 family protein [Brumicola nitratireducens]|uniref:Orphan protein n=1 Tax=Glaciecola nitratireducens (strain JCM 12485 / KCTC 12276 / FR1064) TaxID=1085623 RepID=G4QNX5_GLANF|nr:DUF6702 family protein [Glaciecola nitratireducens]AEP31683.1 hypothetical protein GNIT_3589 [Glaciecola nitratireducens FR1064]